VKQDREAIDTMGKDELERYIERARAEVVGWCAAEIDSGDVDVDTLLEKALRDFG